MTNGYIKTGKFGDFSARGFILGNIKVKATCPPSMLSQPRDGSANTAQYTGSDHDGS